MTSKKTTLFRVILLAITFNLQVFGQVNTFDLLKKFEKEKIQPQSPKNLNLQAFDKLGKKIRELWLESHTTANSKENQPKTTLPSKPLSFAPKSNKPLYYFSTDFIVQVDPRLTTPRLVIPKNGATLVGSKYHNFLLSNTFYEFLNRNKVLFKIENPEKEFKDIQYTKDSEGEITIRFQQYNNGIPVWAKEILAHYTKTGELEFINGNYIPTQKEQLPNAPEISSDQAYSIAKNELIRRTSFEEIPETLKNFVANFETEPELLFYFDESLNKLRLVWKLEIYPNILEKWRYFVDAKSGKIVERYQANPSDGPATGNGIDYFGNTRNLNIFLLQGKYSLVDASKPMYNQNTNNPAGIIATYTNNNSDLTKNSVPTLVQSSNTNFSDPVAVSVHYNLGLVYDYYYRTFQRNSLDNKGLDIITIIHVTDGGQSMPNAYWNGKICVFGDGGGYFHPLGAGLDVVAHELTHGVVSFTVDLEYKFQSGALNEAFADWGGAMVDREDWYIGEDIIRDLSLFPSGRMRDMSDPHNGANPGSPAWLPAHMQEYQDLPIDNDNGGVHINVGIINKATYLIGNAIGKAKLEKIYYRVLDKLYLAKQANFVDFRNACERSAKELFGENSSELIAVRNAFDAVGIGSSGGSSPSPDLPEFIGNRFITVVDADQGFLYLGKDSLSTSQDIQIISQTSLNTESGSPYSITFFGDIIFFIGSDNYLYAINLNTKQQTLISNELEISTIAVSNTDNPILAVTSKEPYPVIFFYDIPKDSNWMVQLYQPTTSHSEVTTQPITAVNLSWNPSGNILVYDAINYKTSLNGEIVYYADINLIEPKSGVITRIFEPLPDGYNIASPMFSQTSNNHLTFVVWDLNTSAGYIYNLNFYDGTLRPVLYSDLNQAQIATPSFSPDDRHLVFQSYSPSYQQYSVWKLSLASDKRTPIGSPWLYLTNAGIPRWFARGIRNSVDLQGENNSILIQPNPFFENFQIVGLMESIPAEISIYNVYGEKIAYYLLQNPKGIETIIPTSKLPSGVYYINIKQGKKTTILNAIQLQ